MKGHLLGQFENKTVLNAIIEALGEELDELDTVFADLHDRRWIDSGDGVQLDGIGTIVGQSRQIADAVQVPFFGFQDQDNAQTFGEGRFRDTWETWLQSVNLSDPEYRPVLWQKIFKNHSFGTAEDTIQSLKFIFNAPAVFLTECGNARIAVGIGRTLSRNDIALASAVDLLIRAGGVGLIAQEYFNYDNYFGFLGQVNAKSFDEGEFADVF